MDMVGMDRDRAGLLHDIALVCDEREGGDDRDNRNRNAEFGMLRLGIITNQADPAPPNRDGRCDNDSRLKQRR